MNKLRFFITAFLLILTGAIGAMESLELPVSVEGKDGYILCDMISFNVKQLKEEEKVYLYTQVNQKFSDRHHCESITSETYKIYQHDDIENEITIDDILNKNVKELYFEKNSSTK